MFIVAFFVIVEDHPPFPQNVLGAEERKQFNQALWSRSNVGAFWRHAKIQISHEIL